MNDSVYKKIKKQNGEAFARTLRNHHDGILEIPDIDKIVRHTGRDAEPLLPYLLSLITKDKESDSTLTPSDPYALLAQAGYTAFHADTLEKQNSIKRYFKPGELLCTFNDAARYQDYHIVHAIRQDADRIQRRDFTGREKRQDEYGTSVISIQMLKEGGFISIKNRYNHTVDHCDNTFGSNPDNIIPGLSAALKAHFNVEFQSYSELPDEYTLIQDRIFRYYSECRNIYYGDQAWVKGGEIHTVDRAAGDAMFDGLLFDNQSKRLHKIDPHLPNSFAEHFNHYYGGQRGLNVDRDGNLRLDDEVLIGADGSRIISLNLPAFTEMDDGCLNTVLHLTHFKASALERMGVGCLYHAPSLTDFEVPALKAMGDCCLTSCDRITHLKTPALTTMGLACFSSAGNLTHVEAPALKAMGNDCFSKSEKIKTFNTALPQARLLTPAPA